MSDSDAYFAELKDQREANAFNAWVESLPAAKPDVSVVADAFLDSDAERFRAALQEIAGMDIRRCSTRSLQEIARKALGETE